MTIGRQVSMYFSAELLALVEEERALREQAAGVKVGRSAVLAQLIRLGLKSVAESRQGSE